MASLFSFTAVYTGPDGAQITENVSKLPWSRTVKASVPFTGKLDVTFARRAQYPDKPIYNIGFTGYITYTTSDGTTGSEVAPQSRVAAADDGVLRLRVYLDEGTDPEGVQMSVAPLRYDKHFAFTFTTDDSPVEAYSRIWSAIHGRWIDNAPCWHLGAARTTGYRPDHRMVSTDGCGNDRPFGFSCAIWPSWGNDLSPNFIRDDVSPESVSPYITWQELRLLSDFGTGLCYHNVDERIYGTGDPARITAGLETDYSRTLEKTGVGLKVLAIPDGNQTYAQAGEQNDRILLTRNTQLGEKVFLRECGSLRKVQVNTGVSSPTIAQKLAELAEQSVTANPYWVSYTVHAPGRDCIDMLEEIYRLYGKSGKDNIWVASWDEIYEYVAMREGAGIARSEEGLTVTFDVALPAIDEYLFTGLTFRVEGVDAESRIEPVSDNIVGMTSSYDAGQMLVNVEFGQRLLLLAEKYTLAYEKNPSIDALADARNFISQLLPELAVPYERRISSVVEPGKNQITRAAVSDYQERYDGYRLGVEKRIEAGKK